MAPLAVLTVEELLQAGALFFMVVPGGAAVGALFGDTLALFVLGRHRPNDWARIGGLISGWVCLGCWLGVLLGMVKS